MGHAPPLIVATLGPASMHLAMDLAASSDVAFRLNASHMSPGALTDAVAAVRRAAPDTRVTIDLQGAKMRVGQFEPVPLSAGQTLRFALDPSGTTAIPVPHPELFRSLRPGDTLSLDDDRVRMTVVSIATGVVDARCATDGVLRPRKGVNVLDHPVELDGLSSQDLANIEAVRRFNGVDFAFSFMLDGREAGWVRSHAPDARIVGKIERREAVDRIDSIARACDELWICRGDLGAQLGPSALARWVSSYRPPTDGVRVMMAGQVLEHLTRHADPTRSEVCHLFDLMDRGYAGIVLSDETAIGDDPVGAVRTARRLLDEMTS